MWCIKNDELYISKVLCLTSDPEKALKFYNSRDAAQAMSILKISDIYVNANMCIQKLKYVEA